MTFVCIQCLSSILVGLGFSKNKVKISQTSAVSLPSVRAAPAEFLRVPASCVLVPLRFFPIPASFVVFRNLKQMLQYLDAATVMF